MSRAKTAAARCRKKDYTRNLFIKIIDNIGYIPYNYLRNIEEDS